MEGDLFAGLVGAVTLFTTCRLLQPATPKLLLSVCLIGQLFALDGMLGSRSRAHIRVGHITFTLAMWLGAFCSAGPELGLVAALAAVAWGSRRALGHCMFSRARGSDATDDPRYDLLYAVPLLVALRRGV